MSFWRFYYHLVWATKNREPVIDQHMERLLKRSFQATFGELKIVPHAIGFMPDHVHLAISIPPSVSVSDAVKRLKGASARTINLEVEAKNFVWQEGYGALTFGEKALPDVVEYVGNQRLRHAANRISKSLERDTDL